MRRRTTSLGLAVLVAGCGGGGGGGGAPAPAPAPAPAAPYSLTFSPATLQLNAPQGVSYLLAVDATIDRTIPEQVNVAIIDRAGVLNPSVSIIAVSPTTYRANLVSASSLTQGVRTGSLEIRICRDDPLTCASPLPGSPWQLPFEFTITAPLTPPSPPPAVPPPIPAPPPPPALGAAIAPASLAVTAYADELPAIPVVGTWSTGVGAVYPRFVDPAGVFQPNPPMTTIPGSSNATLFISPSVAPGTYAGNLQLQLCADLPCTTQHAGSPALLPYAVTVLAATNPTPLSALAGAEDWATFQGNAAHTGYVPITLDSTKFSRRWQWTIPAADPANGGWITPVVTASDRVHFVVSGYFRPAAAYALSESNGSVAWKYDFGSIFSANPPAVSAGKVFLATSGHTDTFMWSFDASNGNNLSKVAFSSQWEHYYAPTIAGGAVYTNGGAYGGMLSFRYSDGGENWFNQALPQFDEWTPAINATHAFTFIGGKLFALDRATGAISYSITDPDWNMYTYSQYSSPILGSGSTVIGVNSRNTVFGSNRLLAFDTANRTVRWSIPGRFSSEPAVANGVVYVVNGSQFEARSEGDGSLLWNWTPNETGTPFDTGNPPANVVITNNLVFVSTNTRVYALSLATRDAVWSYPRGGRLSVSRNGVLYIAPLIGAPGAEGHKLTAVNLQ